MEDSHTTIRVRKDTAKEFMLFKIQSNAKNLDEVLRGVIDKLKKEIQTNEENNSEAITEDSLPSVDSEEWTPIKCKGD